MALSPLKSEKKDRKQFERKNTAENGTPDGPQINDYYIRLSTRYKVAKFSSMLALILFILFMVTSFREEITVENLRYFLRYIDTRQPDTAQESDRIQHEAESVIDMGLYKGSLVLVGNETVSLYDMQGDTLLSVSKTNSSPILLTSDKYILVYNAGGNSFQIYSTVSCLYEDTFDYAISCAALNDNGMFLVATKSREYRSVVHVYDKDFRDIYHWSSPDKYVAAADIKNNDKEFVIAAFGTTQSGDYYTEILVCETGKEEKKAQLRIENAMPLSVAYTARGGFVLFCDTGFYFYNESCELIKTVGFSGEIPVRAETVGDYSYYAMNKNVVGSTHDVTVLDDTGNILFAGQIDGEITDSVLCADAAYFLLEREVVRAAYQTQQTISKTVTAGAMKIMAPDVNTLLICRQSQSEILDVDEYFFGVDETAEE